jgi:MerR family transcriptional regulator, copper efflux regulator
MLVKELSIRTGLSAHAIRFYEKEGLLPKRFIQRAENDYRHYSEEAIDRIATIKILRSAGFTLSEIKELMDKWDSGKLTHSEGSAFMRRKMKEIDDRIVELRQIKKNLIATLGKHDKRG